MAYRFQHWPEPPVISDGPHAATGTGWFGPQKNALYMVANRSLIPWGVKLALAGLAVIMVPIFWRLAVLGAWPILAFLLLAIALLAVAMRSFQQGRPPEEYLTLADGEITHIRMDSHGRPQQTKLPAYWTRLALGGHPGAPDLALVFRGQHHPIGLCLNAAERSEVADIIQQTWPLAH